MATTVTVLENRALRHMGSIENLQKKIDKLYKRVVKCTCSVQRTENMIKASELRKELMAVKMQYDGVMIELYGNAHKRIVL